MELGIACISRGGGARATRPTHIPHRASKSTDRGRALLAQPGRPATQRHRCPAATANCEAWIKKKSASVLTAFGRGWGWRYLSTSVCAHGLARPRRCIFEESGAGLSCVCDRHVPAAEACEWTIRKSSHQKAKAVGHCRSQARTPVKQCEPHSTDGPARQPPLTVVFKPAGRQRANALTC